MFVWENDRERGKRDAARTGGDEGGANALDFALIEAGGPRLVVERHLVPVVEAHHWCQAEVVVQRIRRWQPRCRSDQQTPARPRHLDPVLPSARQALRTSAAAGAADATE